MRHRRGLMTVIMAGLCTAGCHNWLPGPSSQELLDRFPTPIYSLTGEILNGPSSPRLNCTEAQEAWLKRISPADDSLTLEQLQAEARLQFERMDINHDGVITSAELSIYRTPQQNAAPEEAKDSRNVRRMPLRPHTSQPDPVLSADANLDFQVTLDEFLTYQAELFHQMDVNQHHKLTIHELSALCHQREQAAHETNR